MSTNFPTSLQDLDATRGTAGQTLSSPNHITHHQKEDDTIGALQTKVGINSSADTTSLDYKLKSTSSIDPGHKHTTSSISSDPAGVFVPTGGVIQYPNTTPPTGYFLCNGQAVSRTTYSTLFSLIGTQFGIGDNSTTFNLPSNLSTNGNGFGSADFGVSNTNKSLSIASALGVGSSNFTMSCWVKIQTEPASGEVQTFLMLGETAGDTHPVVGYQNSGGTKRLVFLRNKDGVAADVVYYNTTLGTSNWHLIAMKWDGSTLKGWLDGVEVASLASSGGGSINVTDAFAISGLSGGGLLATDYGTNGYAKAFIDDVRVWNTNRSDANLITDYTTPGELTGTETNLRAYYKLNTSLIADSTSNAYTLTNNNTVILATTVPFLSGVIGSNPMIKY